MNSLTREKAKDSRFRALILYNVQRLPTTTSPSKSLPKTTTTTSPKNNNNNSKSHPTFVFANVGQLQLYAPGEKGILRLQSDDGFQTQLLHRRADLLQLPTGDVGDSDVADFSRPNQVVKRLQRFCRVHFQTRERTREEEEQEEDEEEEKKKREEKGEIRQNRPGFGKYK